MLRLACLLSFAALVATSRADTILGPYIPLFKGIDRAVGTNTPTGSGMPDLQVINILRVDLTDPDIKLFATPRVTNWVSESRETAALSVGKFVANYKVQVAVNANDFSQYVGSGSPPYNIATGTPLDVTGVLISQGQIVSSQQSYDQYQCAIFFDANKQASYAFTNWPAHSTAGVDTALCGTHPILINGVNVGYNYLGSSVFIHLVQPRTIVGVSSDNHYLFLVTIDGRQSGYSDGALDWEAGKWMLMAGAYNAINMDGGGSTTMDMADSTGVPIELNRSSCLVAYGYERPVGAHIGVFAKPVVGFINDVTPNVDNTAATITWTTTSPATTQLKYGLDSTMSSSTTQFPALVTNHAAMISGLLPNTGYYFKAASVVNGVTYYSSNFYLVTSNYVTTNAIFDVDNTWKYATTNLDGIAWTNKTYNDTNWVTGSGVFWVDVDGPNYSYPMLSTQLPGDDNNFGFPLPTYYFRTHFKYTNAVSNVTLNMAAYVDDGAVFYLNGREIYRLRMPAYPTKIYNTTYATNSPANPGTPDVFEIKGSPMTNLVSGDNVLAVEVHNRSAFNGATYFGLSMTATPQYNIQPQISVTPTNNNMSVLSWSQGGFTLYQSTSIPGTWTPVTGPTGAIVSSPYAVTNTTTARFYKLRRY